MSLLFGFTKKSTASGWPVGGQSRMGSKSSPAARVPSEVAQIYSHFMEIRATMWLSLTAKGHSEVPMTHSSASFTRKISQRMHKMERERVPGMRKFSNHSGKNDGSTDPFSLTIF